MQTLINLLIFFLILTAIITIHEFGHFVAAKMFGVYCGAFSIGMGPKIYGKKGKETEFQIRALPIGGFVTMAGETDQEEETEFKDVPKERSLKGKKTYQKVIIFLAGIFNNFLLGFLILMVLNTTVGTIPVEQPVIGQVVADSGAETAGIQAGDTITEIAYDGKIFAIDHFDDITKALTVKNAANKSVTIKVTLIRDGEKQTVNVNAGYNSKVSRYQMGIIQATRKMGFGEAIGSTFTEVGSMALMVFTALKGLALHFSSTVKQMSGPVGIYSVTAQVASTGNVANLFYLMALLSINIGVFNLLPIPGLDGAHTLIALVEGVLHRELPQNVKYGLQLAGLALVLLLMLYITFQDIMKLL